MILIKYGTEDNNINVTDICYSKLLKGDIITIPAGDQIRCIYFTDPIFGTVKKIFIIKDDIITDYAENDTIKINIRDLTITKESDDYIIQKLSNIHSKLQIKYGYFYEEYPEQMMAVKFLTGKEKVLEIGANIGRNSLIIASILEDSSNLVSMECDKEISNQLLENRDLNNLQFHIETSALSKRSLIQKEWDTVVSETLLDGYKWVNTINLNDLWAKYCIKFDTLVLDCEGAFYYILYDMPEILENINLIIMENDYHDINHKEYIDKILVENNFIVEYKNAGGFNPCYNFFYEVWRRA
jgi:FkbM family methyltransferase